MGVDPPLAGIKKRKERKLTFLGAKKGASPGGKEGNIEKGAKKPGGKEDGCPKEYRRGDGLEKVGASISA